jgi:hypothetical protein
MKLKTTLLRRVIKEEIEIIQFRNLIREMIESEVTRGRIRDALNQSFVAKLGIDLDKFIDDNSDTLQSLLGMGSLSFLGSGRQGSAFELGDKVLKLEPGAPRAAEIEDALYFGDDKGKAGLPSVIDSGTMQSTAGPIGWSIIEKLKDADSLGKDEDWTALWALIRDGISSLVKTQKTSFKDIDPDEIATKLNLPQDLVAKVSEKFRLSNDWLSNFLAGMQANYKLGMVDFKPDNMGIRRSGGEGNVVFFDAASAKKRDIKKWETPEKKTAKK